MDYQEFAKKYGTEKQCLDYLYKLRWPDGFRCPRCKHDKAWTIDEDKHKYKCQGKDKDCWYITSVTAGTIFHNTQKPITDWFRAIWYVSSQIGGTSALGLKKELGLGSYRTALTWLQKLRKVMIYSEQDKLQGVVAVDIFPFASNDVMIAVEINDNKNRQIRMSSVRCFKDILSDINAFVEANVEIDSLIICAKRDKDKYIGLSDKGYKLEFVPKVREGSYVQLSPVNEVLAYIKEKKLLCTLERTDDSKYYDYYLDECCFKFNRRDSQKTWFSMLLKNAIQSKPIPYEEIKKPQAKKEE